MPKTKRYTEKRFVMLTPAQGRQGVGPISGHRAKLRCQS